VSSKYLEETVSPKYNDRSRAESADARPHQKSNMPVSSGKAIVGWRNGCARDQVPRRAVENVSTEVELSRLNTNNTPKGPAESAVTAFSAEKAALELEPSIRKLETPLFAVFAGVRFEGGTFSRPADPPSTSSLSEGQNRGGCLF